MTGEQLRAWRTERGLSLAELGKLLGVDWTTPQRWETGRTTMPPYLGLALGYLDDHETWRGPRTDYASPDERLRLSA